MSRHFDHAEGLTETHDPATHDYVFNQTMFRIKDPKRTLAFYSDVLGMTLIKRFDFPDMEFTLYFLAALSPDEVNEISTDTDERIVQTFARPAMLELTHNWGDESNDDVSYHNGNSDPRGFGHIGFAVPNIDDACARFEAMDVTFIKKPNEGKMKDIAFIQDPDGYWIEIFTPKRQPDSLKEHLA